jgi:peptidoglycan L-alanyl-D-glutamate endopeptidase CwlK
VSFKFSQRSLNHLNGVHPALVAVMKRAIQITPVDFAIIDGIRTVDEQRELFRRGATKTMNSRHLTGHAVDVAPFIGGRIRWDWPPFHVIAKAVKDAAAEDNIKIVWGGDWKSFPDGPHFELDRRYYK